MSTTNITAFLASAITAAQATPVSPALARKMITLLSPKQRKIRQGTVAKYAQIMRDGRWTLSSDMIAFDWDHYLINGHHRLLAVIESNTTQLFFVVSDMDPAAFLIIDRQRTRTLSQFLKGAKHSKHIGGICSFIARWEQSLPLAGARNVIEMDEQAEILGRAESSIFDSIEHIYNTKSSVLGHQSFQAFLHWAYIHGEGHDEEVIGEFFAKCGSGANLAPGDPVLALRNRLLLSPIKHTKVDSYAYFIKALNAHIEGVSMKICRYASYEDFPEIISVRQAKGGAA